MPSKSTQPTCQIISKSTIHPTTKSTLKDLKLSTSDLPMLSCHYIQKGNLFIKPPMLMSDLLTHLRENLSKALTHFPPLAGRLKTDTNGYVYITSNDAGAQFIHANATNITVTNILSPIHVPDIVKEFFAFNGMISYNGHFNPLLSVQVTELGDGVFIGFSVNHAVVDGTSLWNFINTFADICKKKKNLMQVIRPLNQLTYTSEQTNLATKQPCFTRDSIMISPEVLKIPASGLKVTFNEFTPLVERIFTFSSESIFKLKAKTNNRKNVTDIIGSLLQNAVVSKTETVSVISSFQSLCALLWRAITRARCLPIAKLTTFRMAVNCRHRLEPKLEAFYFGNAIQSVPTYATAGDVLSHDIRWCAEQLNKTVLSHDDMMVRRFVRKWEEDPKCFPLGNFDGAMVTMGSSPRFPMLENDFGWGKPVAVRSGRANKFDGKVSAFPGRAGGGSVDLEVVLSPETMAELELDSEFMQYVSGC